MSSNAATVYNLNIDRARQGAPTLLDDSTFYVCCYSSATLGALSATGTATFPFLAMDEVSINSSPVNQAIDQSGSSLFPGFRGLTGNQTFTIRFAWTTNVSSNNDEAAARFGLASTTSGVSAGAYPGLGSRIIEDDGHFVTATVEVVSGGDSDGDGVSGLTDNCPSVSNTPQENTDGAADGVTHVIPMMTMTPMRTPMRTPVITAPRCRTMIS